jgi:hypothetical protein
MIADNASRHIRLRYRGAFHLDSWIALGLQRR